MLASTGTAPPVPRGRASYTDPDYSRSPERAFKKHKTLPHPKNQRHSASHPPLDVSRSITIQTSSRASRPSNSSLKRLNPPKLRNETPSVGLAPGPDPPPTPPAHSRASSSTHSTIPSSPTFVESPVKSSGESFAQTPETPPNQKSPPTPDVTPPQRSGPPRAFRPVLSDRIPSKATTDSRTESFKTARETPYSSEEEENASMRPLLSSDRTSQSTMRPIITETRSRETGLGLGLESETDLTPRTKQEFTIFDGEWGSTSEVEQEWDDNLQRHVVVRKRQAKPRVNGHKQEVLEDVTVTPTNATKALRAMPLHDRFQTQPSPVTKDRKRHATAPARSVSSTSTDVKRSSAQSSKSTNSTIVEAFLVESPPRRQQTLRHMKKHPTLRESGSDMSRSSSLVSPARPVESRAVQRGPRTDSVVSTNTVNSIASRKARREVWKNGGIPVVVVPDRNSSMKSGETRSLRSTSSRRSKRSNSLNSAALSHDLKAADMTPYFDKPSRRGRSMSESEGSGPGDQRTIDYPPRVPVRTSSLSAPTSRNTSRAGSRAGSLTAESLKAHNAFNDHQTAKLLPPPQVTVEHAPAAEPSGEKQVNAGVTNPRQQSQPAASVEPYKETAGDNRLSLHQQSSGDHFLGRRLNTPNTPFSLASIETSGTHSAAEVSEAMAVNIYPHQNKSVLMVDHTPNTADSSNSANANSTARQASSGTDKTVIVVKPKPTTGDVDELPITPPQPHFSMDDIDSPLRNPREPPEPPAIKFIPATPSGLTPAGEKAKTMGNYFETTTEKRPSLIRRAFSLTRRYSEGSEPRTPGILTRSLSLTRNIRRDTAENPALETRKDAVLHQYPTSKEPPPEEAKLHPFWRPSSSHFSTAAGEDGDDWVYDIPDEVDRVYRYPAIDQRPGRPRRRSSLSERVKRTFAILPIQDDYDFVDYADVESQAPERRTIKRTPSGNLRVMRYRDSYSTLRWPGQHSRAPADANPSHDGYYDESGRPSTAPEHAGKRAWGVDKKTDGQGRRIFPGWQDKLEMYRPINLQRRLSEHRRQKRSEALRRQISGPREVRDGVGEVIKRNSYNGPSYQTPTGIHAQADEAAESEGVEEAVPV